MSKISKCTFASAQWPATRGGKFFAFCFFWFVYWDYDDFVQLQCDVGGMEQRYQACQRQRWQNGQDLVSGLDGHFWVPTYADRPWVLSPSPLAVTNCSIMRCFAMHYSSKATIESIAYSCLSGSCRQCSQFNLIFSLCLKVQCLHFQCLHFTRHHTQSECDLQWI